MKTIEIKEDGVVIKTAYLQKHGGTFAPDSLKLGGEKFWMMNEPPYLYLDHNGNEIVYGQDIIAVRIKSHSRLFEALMWLPFGQTATGSDDELNTEHFAIFTTKEAADQFVSENRPKPLLTTFDGVEIYDGNLTVYIVDKKNYHLDQIKAENIERNRLFYNHVFSSRQAANDYIKRHKAVLSLDMIENGLTDEGHEWSNPVVQEVFRTITKLVNEQFKPQ